MVCCRTSHHCTNPLVHTFYFMFLCNQRSRQRTTKTKCWKWKREPGRNHEIERGTRIKGSWSSCLQHGPLVLWSVYSLMSECCHIKRLSERVSFHQIDSYVPHLGTYINNPTPIMPIHVPQIFDIWILFHISLLLFFIICSYNVLFNFLFDIIRSYLKKSHRSFPYGIGLFQNLQDETGLQKQVDTHSVLCCIIAGGGVGYNLTVCCWSGALIPFAKLWKWNTISYTHPIAFEKYRHSLLWKIVGWYILCHFMPLRYLGQVDRI